MANLKNLIESVVRGEKVDEAAFHSDDGVGFVPDVEFDTRKDLPNKGDMSQEGDGLSKDAKNAKLKKKNYDLVQKNIRASEVKEAKDEDEDDVEKDDEDNCEVGKGKKELEELSKDTLKNYVRGATADAIAKSYKAGTSKAGSASRDKYADKATKRDFGIGKAVEKMSDKNYGTGLKSGEYKRHDDGDYRFVSKSKNGLVRSFKSEKGAADHAGSVRESYHVTADDFDVSEDISAIFNGEELSEGFIDKVTNIYQTSIIAKANEIVESVVSDLNEAFESEKAELIEALEEAWEEKLEETTDLVDRYLDKVVTEWKQENEVAIEHSVKADIAEGFMSKLKDLFEEYYIDVPESKVDVVAEQSQYIEELQAKLEEEISNNMALVEALESEKKNKIFESKLDDLSESQKNKFRLLSEAVSFEDEEDYEVKLDEIKQHYFTRKTKVNSIDEHVSPIALTEEVEYSSKDPAVKVVVDNIGKYFKK